MGEQNARKNSRFAGAVMDYNTPIRIKQYQQNLDFSQGLISYQDSENSKRRRTRDTLNRHASSQGYKVSHAEEYDLRPAALKWTNEKT